MRTNEILCGDAMTEMSRMPDDWVDLIVADPPYNSGKNYGNNIDSISWREYRDFTEDWLTQATRVLKPTGSIYVFMGMRFISRLFIMMEEDFGLNFNGWVTWHYTQGMGRKNGFSPRHEDILHFTKTADFTFNLDDVRIPQKYFRKRNNMTGANPGDVWEFSHVHYCSAEREPHPTQKPEALLARIISASSHPGDLVLDPFVGSGTTCRVAQVLNRRWIGIEINPGYVELSNQRIRAEFEGMDSIDPRSDRTPKDAPQLSLDQPLLLESESCKN